MDARRIVTQTDDTSLAKDIASTRLKDFLEKINSIAKKYEATLNKNWKEIFNHLVNLSADPDSSDNPQEQMLYVLCELSAIITLMSGKRIYALKKCIEDLYTAMFSELEELDKLNEHTKDWNTISLCIPNSPGRYANALEDVLSSLRANIKPSEKQLRNGVTFTLEHIKHFQKMLGQCADLYFYHNDLIENNGEAAYSALKSIAEKADFTKTDLLDQFRVMLNAVNDIISDESVFSITPELFQNIIYNELVLLKECALEPTNAVTLKIANLYALNQLNDYCKFGSDRMLAAKKWGITLTDATLTDQLWQLAECDRHAEKIASEVKKLHFGNYHISTESAFKEDVSGLFWNPRNLLIATLEGFIQAYCDQELFNSHNCAIEDIAIKIDVNLQTLLNKHYKPLSTTLDYRADDCMETERAYQHMQLLNRATNSYAFAVIKDNLQYVPDNRGVMLPANAEEIIEKYNRGGEKAYNEYLANKPKKASVLPPAIGVASGANNSDNGKNVDARLTPPADSEKLPSQDAALPSSLLNAADAGDPSLSPARRRPKSSTALAFEGLNHPLVRVEPVPEGDSPLPSPRTGNISFDLIDTTSWSRLKKALVAIALISLFALIACGVTAAILYCAPVPLVAATATTIAITTTNASILGPVVVAGILGGILAAGLMIGLVLGLIWGRKSKNAPSPLDIPAASPIPTPPASADNSRTPSPRSLHNKTRSPSLADVQSPRRTRSGSESRLYQPQRAEDAIIIADKPRSLPALVSQGAQSPRN